MEAPLEDIIAAVQAMYLEGSIAPVAPYLDDGVVLDWSGSIGPYRGIYRGYDNAQEFLSTIIESFEGIRWEPFDPVEIGDRVAMGSRFAARGSASGVEATGVGGQTWELAAGRIIAIKLHQSRADAVRWVRREVLGDARLYFVSDAPGGDADTRSVLEGAFCGGADIVQLRDRELRGARLAAAAATFASTAHDAGALFFVNDDPALAKAVGADGVHVGQDDLGVAEARSIAGDELLVGLSTHSPKQLDSACGSAGDARPDYFSVGPVWATPTKPGRRATGIDYVRYAAANATLPWFAIGGIDAGNVEAVVAAGGRRVVVVRAIRDAADPAAAALRLRSVLDQAMVKSA